MPFSPGSSSPLQPKAQDAPTPDLYHHHLSRTPSPYPNTSSSSSFDRHSTRSPHQHHHHHLHRRASYSPPRSRSASAAARHRRGSGVFFNAIPAQLGLSPAQFQQARRSEDELRQVKCQDRRHRAAVQQYYRDLNELLDAFDEVEGVLADHREYERQRVEALRRKREEQQLERLRQGYWRDGGWSPSLRDEQARNVDDEEQRQQQQQHGTDGTDGTGKVVESRFGEDGGKTTTPTTTGIHHQQQPVIVEHSPAAEPLQGQGANGYGAIGPQTPSLETATCVVIHAGDSEVTETDETAPLLATNGAKRSQRSSSRSIELAISISMAANIVLVLSKIWTVVMSSSLAVLASMIDSLMDLLSGGIVWYSVRMRKDAMDGHRYPVGKARMEPLGVIVFGSVMMTSFAQVLLQSVERLLAGKEEAPVELDRVTLLLLAANILLKLALWLWCRTIKNSSSVQAIAQDHYIDVIFNTFSTFFPVAGTFLSLWWLDAAGAIALSIFIIYKWAETCLDNIRRLTGHAASAKDVQQLTYMAYRFSDLIEAIDTVRSYYVGDGLFVEVDIVMARDSPLPLAHDIGESLQEALECLEMVERAFVHIDIDVDHEIEHRKAVNRLLV